MRCVQRGGGTGGGGRCDRCAGLVKSCKACAPAPRAPSALPRASRQKTEVRLGQVWRVTMGSGTQVRGFSGVFRVPWFHGSGFMGFNLITKSLVAMHPAPQTTAEPRSSRFRQTESVWGGVLLARRPRGAMAPVGTLVLDVKRAEGRCRTGASAWGDIPKGSELFVKGAAPARPAPRAARHRAPPGAPEGAPSGFAGGGAGVRGRGGAPGRVPATAGAARRPALRSPAPRGVPAAPPAPSGGRWMDGSGAAGTGRERAGLAAWRVGEVHGSTSSASPSPSARRTTPRRGTASARATRGCRCGA